MAFLLCLMGWQQSSQGNRMTQELVTYHNIFLTISLEFNSIPISISIYVFIVQFSQKRIPRKTPKALPSTGYVLVKMK